MAKPSCGIVGEVMTELARDIERSRPSVLRRGRFRASAASSKSCMSLSRLFGGGGRGSTFCVVVDITIEGPERNKACSIIGP